MVGWMFAIGLFWIIAAVQFGGLLDAESGSGFRQLLGLLATLAIYLGLVFALKMALGGVLGLFGDEILPIALPLLALGWIGRAGFRLFGITLKRVPFGADAH